MNFAKIFTNFKASFLFGEIAVGSTLWHNFKWLQAFVERSTTPKIRSPNSKGFDSVDFYHLPFTSSENTRIRGWSLKSPCVDEARWSFELRAVRQNASETYQNTIKLKIFIFSCFPAEAVRSLQSRGPPLIGVLPLKITIALSEF